MQIYCRIKIILWIFIYLIVIPAWALPSDRQQPISIEADHADLDDKKSISIYRGNITLTQGSMILKCNVLTTYHAQETRALIKAVAEGSPVSFHQRPAADKEEIIATALRMEYLADKQLVHLLDKAEVTQGKNIFRSKRIEYNMIDNQVHAEGGQNQGERVKVTLFPQEQSKISSTTNSTSKSKNSNQSGDQ